MKKVYIISVLLSIIVLLSALNNKEIKAQTKVKKSSGPPSCYAGEPLAMRNCSFSGCHDDGVANTGTAQLSLNLGDNEFGYEPNKTYKITIDLNKSDLLRAGFQVIALQENDLKVSPGTVKMTTNRTQTLPGGHGADCSLTGKTWVEHNLTGTSPNTTTGANWTFEWTAPSTNVGNIVFYLAALESNNSDDEFGDKTYTLSKVMKPKSVDGIDNQVLATYISVFPNPSKGEISVSIPDNLNLDKVQILNTKGQTELVFDKFYLTKQNNANLTFDISTLKSGVYFLQLNTGLNTVYKKVVVSTE